MPRYEDGCILCDHDFGAGERYLGVCESCYCDLKERYQALIRENFTEPEINWLIEMDELMTMVFDWLKELGDSV